MRVVMMNGVQIEKKSVSQKSMPVLATPSCCSMGLDAIFWYQRVGAGDVSVHHSSASPAGAQEFRVHHQKVNAVYISSVVKAWVSSRDQYWPPSTALLKAHKFEVLHFHVALLIREFTLQLKIEILFLIKACPLILFLPRILGYNDVCSSFRCLMHSPVLKEATSTSIIRPEMHLKH